MKEKKLTDFVYNEHFDLHLYITYLLQNNETAKNDRKIVHV
ncbi:hypothetical protein [Bacillus sp. B15-48]|nr:hypothetical protein [Bacillus sp. B15-48]